MTREVRFSQTAANKLSKLLAYLENEWSEKVKSEFLSKLKTKLGQIENFPESNKKSGKIKGLYQCVLSKQTTLYYTFDENFIYVFTLFDTRQDPNKLNKEL